MLPDLSSVRIYSGDPTASEPPGRPMLAWRGDGLFLRARSKASRVSVPDRLLAASVFREEAGLESFARVGVARAAVPERFGSFRGCIEAAHHAGMKYLETTQEVRFLPERLLPGARSIVCLAASHSPRPLVASDGATVARYASGADYHGTLRQRAERVARAAAGRLGNFRYRVCVDSTPLSERSFAAAAGLGWIGKNGCLIDPEHGSYLLLVEILTDLDLPPDEPVAVRCVRALPREVPDRRLRRARFSRCRAMHRLLDDRAPGADPRRREGEDGPSRLRLRRVPGRVPGD